MKLHDAIKLAASVVSKNSTLPIMQCLAVKSDGNSIQAIGSNFELGIEVTAEFKTIPFDGCVNAEKLANALAVMPEPTIRIGDDRMTISQGRSRVVIPILPYQDHPGMPEAQIDSQDLTFDIWSLISRVQYAAARQDVRYYLCGVYIESTGTELNAVATDGHRMAVATEPAELPPFGLIIPASSLKSLMGIKPDTFRTGNCIVGTQGPIRIYSKLIDGKYPDYRRVMPSPENMLVINTAEFKSALKTLKPFGNTKYMGVRLKWSETSLTASVASEAGDESEVTIDITADTCGEIGSNLIYLEDVFSSSKSEFLSVGYIDANRAMRIEDDGTTHIVMPMKL